MTILVWIILGALAVVIAPLTLKELLGSRSVAQANHLTCYIGALLLDDSLRAAHKESFERFLLESKETNAEALSTRALLSIQAMSERNAGNSVLAFHGIVWNRKQALEKEAK